MNLVLDIKVDDVTTAKTIVAALNGLFGLTSVGIYIDNATVENHSDDEPELELIVNGDPVGE